MNRTQIIFYKSCLDSERLAVFFYFWFISYFFFLQFLDNIVQNLTEEKFRKIRKSNKAFQDRVGSMEGTEMFLEACGFQNKTIEDQEFWVFPAEVKRKYLYKNYTDFKDVLFIFILFEGRPRNLTNAEGSLDWS